MRAKFSICLGAFILLLVGLTPSCSSQRKLSGLKKQPVAANIRLGKEMDLPEMIQSGPVKRDTMKVRDLEGKEVLIMRAIKDEATGEMVATEELKAAVVTARFRNVAERRGEVDLEFQVIVTDSLRDSKWQLCFFPKMYILGDTVKLDPVLITGTEFRKSQMRGYQQYDKFLQSISRDSLYFIDEAQLEIFLERNIPQIFKFKNDTSFVSDEEFASAFGVTEKQAIEHYTNRSRIAANARKVGRRGRMFDKYVRNPIRTDGIRLDTVLRGNGEFIYNYVQTIRTMPKLRKVDIVLSGEIRDARTKLYTIPQSDPLTFYISSLSSFVDDTEHFKMMVVERKAAANTAFNIDFAVAKSDIDKNLGENRKELAEIERTLSSLMENKVFDLDSVVVTASCSPEGKYSYNRSLAQRRAQSVTGYFSRYMREYLDSLNAERGFSVDEQGNVVKSERMRAIPMRAGSLAENWPELDRLVMNDTTLSRREKDAYFALSSKRDADSREYAMKQMSSYQYIKTRMYPKLRTVQFDFFLHRKGMVKDTVHTTVLDTLYMEGVQAVKDRDFDLAIRILRPYNDFNTAVAYLAMDYNSSAMSILEKEARTAKVNYMLAILYSRTGDEQKAVECYLHACEQEPMYVHRGNLDPEISALIKRYNLNAQKDDEFNL